MARSGFPTVSVKGTGPYDVHVTDEDGNEVQGIVKVEIGPIEKLPLIKLTVLANLAEIDVQAEASTQTNDFVGVVAASMERARAYAIELGLDPRSQFVVLLTPDTPDRVRGCRLSSVYWDKEWDFHASYEKIVRLQDAILPALQA